MICQEMKVKVITSGVGKLIVQVTCFWVCLRLIDVFGDVLKR